MENTGNLVSKEKEIVLKAINPRKMTNSVPFTFSASEDYQKRGAFAVERDKEFRTTMLAIGIDGLLDDSSFDRVARKYLGELTISLSASVRNLLYLNRPEDYLKYLVIKYLPYIKSEGEEDEKTLFTIHDEDKSIKNNMSNMENKVKAITMLGNMSKANHLRYCRYILGRNVNNIDSTKAMNLLYDYIDNKAKLDGVRNGSEIFIDLTKHADCEYMLLAKELEEHGASPNPKIQFTKKNGAYYFGEESIGMGEVAIVLWLKNKKNKDAVEMMKTAIGYYQ